MKKNKKLYTTILFTLILSCITALTAFAGWEQEGEVWHYRGPDQELIKGSWVFDMGKNYYINADGIMVTGKQLVNGRECTFDATGALIDDSAPMHIEGLDDEMLAAAREKVKEYWQGIMTGYAMVCLSREKNEVPPVILNYDMCIAATYRCQQMLNATDDYYSGPDEKGEMLWNSVTRAILQEPQFVGTENKSMQWTTMPGIMSDEDGGVSDVFSLLNGQFNSPPHYAQIIGPEYTQIGIGLFYRPDYMKMYITEIIRVGK